MTSDLPRLRIHPLCVGLFGGPIDPTTPAPRDPVYISAMFMFLITGGEHPVLVDTGTLDPEFARHRQSRLLYRPAEMEPENALLAHGVRPEDIRTVINTHLHWDHCANNHLFHDATIYVQRAEIGHAAWPLQEHRPFYDKIPGVQPAWLQAWDRIEAVEGDRELLPGISLVWLPGHSPGSQGVLVETAVGRFLIAGDTVNSFQDWAGDGEGSHNAPSLMTSPADWAASARKIDELECTVIPSHDLALLDHAVFGS